MSSSSSSDEEDERLKDALDSSLMSQDLYSTSKSNPEPVINGAAPVNGEKIKPEVQKSSQKSLRRDKIAEETEDNSIQIKLSSVVKVTPEFQKYIAKHLDIAIENSLLETASEKSTKQLPHDKEQEFGVKLLKRSAKPVDLTEVPEIKLKRPNLLKHRSIPDANDLTAEELSSIAVTTEQVLAKTGTEYYANRFASRVEEGITKTKKKKKWKRKKKTENEKDSETKTESKSPVNGVVNDVEGSGKKKKKKKKKNKDNVEVTVINGENNSEKGENGLDTNGQPNNANDNPIKKKKKKKKKKKNVNESNTNGDNKIDTDSNLINGATS